MGMVSDFFWFLDEMIGCFSWSKKQKSREEMRTVVTVDNVEKKVPWSGNYKEALKLVTNAIIKTSGDINWYYGWSYPLILHLNTYEEMFTVQRNVFVTKNDVCLIESTREFWWCHQVPAQNRKMWTRLDPDDMWEAWDFLHKITKCAYCGNEIEESEPCSSCGGRETRYESH